MQTLRSALALGAALATLLSASPLSAQDVQYETLTRVEFSGPLGAVVRLAARIGGAQMETLESTYVQGHKVRTDEEGVSTILDLEALRFTHIDHGARTFSTMTFAQMLERLQAATEQAAGAADEAAAAAPQPTDGEVRLTFRFSAAEANERERISGYDSERFFLTMEAEQEYSPADGSPGERGGTFVVFMDVWSSRDMPGLPSVPEVDEQLARDLTNMGSSMAEALSTAFAQDPSLAAGFERSLEELEKMEGVPMRTVSHFLTVAPDREFDREMVLNTAERQGPSVAQQAAGAALGGLAGRFLGRGGGAPPPEPEPEPTQVTVLKITSEVRDVRTGPLDPSLFEVPAGYREVSFPMP